MAGSAATAGASDSRYILLTDICRSSRLSELYPGQYAEVLDAHNAVVEEAVEASAGHVYKNTGDGYIVFFDRATDCLACAVRLQGAFSAIPDLGDDDPFLVRIVAHAGRLRAVGDEYFGPALNRASRICQVCHPGQVLVSAAITDAVGRSPDDTELIDLGGHHLQDLAEPEHLYQLDHEDFARIEFPPLPTLGNRPNNLVEQPNAFIGRERELAELKAMLFDGKRSITITAPGGYGKSRLAVHLCADLLTAFERGVFFVELAPLRDHTDIATALASAMGFQFYGRRDPKEQLVDYLREKELLLCFDNFEHVLASASFIGDILKEAPQVKVVVTSREPLRITGEQVYPLEPLPVHMPGQADRPHSDAALLFADRAVLVSPSFAPDAAELASVHAICERLDGIPLAIELAAAWMDSFTLSELLAELDQQLELTARLSDVPQRHRSLRASLDWSWNLLSEEQRRMLMQLATFRGGYFAGAASAVLGMRGTPLRQELAKLADKSWLFTREVDGQTRFFIRDAASHEYAFEKLEETRVDGASSLYEQAVMEHARYFSDLMAHEGERLYGHCQLEALRRIGLELQNIYEALDTLHQRTRQEDANEDTATLLLPIASSLWKFLDMTSEHHELVKRYRGLKDVAEQAGNLEQILFWALLGCSQGRWRLGEYDAARTDSHRARLIAKSTGDHHGVALSQHNLGFVELHQGNYDAARGLYADSLAIEREIGDRRGIASALSSLGILEYSQGNYDAARGLYADSLAILREIGDRSGIASSLGNLGILEYSQGNYDAARGLYADSLAIKREIGDRSGIASSLSNLGITEYSQGNYDAARGLYADSLAIWREIGDRAGLAASLNNLGLVENNQGNYDAARGLFADSLAIKREIGDRSGIAWSLYNLGYVENSQGNYDAARDLYAEGLAILREIGDRSGIAWSLYGMGLVESNQGNYDAARGLYADSLAIFREIGVSTGICETIAAVGCLLATNAQGQAGPICLYGASYHAAQLGYTFEPMERELLEQGLAIIEHPETGLPPAERERLKAQAEAMSLDELAEYALDALKKLEPE